MKSTTDATTTSIKSCIEAKTVWDPQKRGFFVPKTVRKFKPDWSFHEREHEREDYLAKHKEEVVLLESDVGQRRFEFVMKAVGDSFVQKNYELVELVVRSLMVCTNCDVSATLSRAMSYFDFYTDLFGDLGQKQALEDDELRESLEMNCFQAFENVDQDGRAMIWGLFCKAKPGDERTSMVQLLKVLNYIIIRTLRNNYSVQKNGFIMLSDMIGLKFENFTFTMPRTFSFMLSKFMPAKIHRVCLLRPLYFVQFILPATRSYMFSGNMCNRFHVLSQDPRDLMHMPLNLRPEILPSMLGGNNNSYNFLNRLRAWRLEEQENEYSNGSSCSGGDDLKEDMLFDTAQNNNRRQRKQESSQTREFAEDSTMDLDSK